MDAYVALEVCRDATQSELLEAYRRLSLLYHPHRNTTNRININRLTASPVRGDDKSSNNVGMDAMLEEYRAFALLSQCYETLSDDMTRRRYDFLFSSIQKKKQEEQSLGKQLFCNALNRMDIRNLNANVMNASNNSGSATTTTSILHVHAAGGAAADHAEQQQQQQQASSRTVTCNDEDPFIRTMHRARDFKPFTDPFQLFAKVHGSDIFDQSHKHHSQQYIYLYSAMNHVGEFNNLDGSTLSTSRDNAGSSMSGTGGSSSMEDYMNNNNTQKQNGKSLSRLRNMLGRPRKGLKRAWFSACQSPIAACTAADTANSVDDSAVMPLTSNYFTEAATSAVQQSLDMSNNAESSKTTTVYVTDPDNPELPPTVIKTTIRVINGKIIRRTETTVSIPLDDGSAVRKETTVEVTSEEIDLFMGSTDDGDCCDEQCCDGNADIAVGGGKCNDRSLREFLESCCTGYCTGGVCSGASVHNE